MGHRMNSEVRIVDNRVFLLGLDEFYRESMKQHEREELLSCARHVTAVLGLVPETVPIEGYYSEDEKLSEYFCLMRALQQVSGARRPEVAGNAGFERLLQVTSSRIFGIESHESNLQRRTLLPVRKDALSFAMESTFPDWTITNLSEHAFEHANQSDDYSLVALAALSRDAVVLTALRESVVLYAAAVGGGVSRNAEYVWAVDELIQHRGTQFVSAFNELFNENIPTPCAENAEVFWNSSHPWEILGRCVRIGFDPGILPIRHYHWAIEIDEGNRLCPVDFWDTEIWTTA